MVEEEQNERFGMVREILEGKLLPASPDLTILNEIRTAGGHLAELLSPTGNPREMSWAMKWLDDVGIDESNPVTLALFSMKWIDSYVAIVKFLRIYKPI